MSKLFLLRSVRLKIQWFSQRFIVRFCGPTRERVLSGNSKYCKTQITRPAFIETMPPEQQFQVLIKYRPFVRLIAVFNIDNFVTGRRTFRHNVAQAVRNCVFLLALVCVASNNFRSSLVTHGWSQEAFYFTAALCEMQQFLMYVLLARNSRQIAGALEQLQRLVKKRTSKLEHFSAIVSWFEPTFPKTLFHSMF